MRRKPGHPFWVPLVILLIGGLGIQAAAPLLNGLTINGFPFGYYTAAQLAPLLLAGTALWAARPWERDGTDLAQKGLGSAIARSGLGLAAAVLGGAAMLAVPAAAYAIGHDGLHLLLGLAAGLLLAVLMRGPTGAAHRPSRGLASALLRTGLLIAVAFLIGAELSAAAAMLPPLLAAFPELPRDAVLAAALFFPAALAAALALASLAAWRPAASHAEIAAFAIVALCVLAATGLLALQATGIGVPHIGYGPVLRDISGFERGLIMAGLADPVTLTGHTRPFNSLSLENFLAVTAAMALGVAALPVLSGTGTTTAARPTRQALAWATVIIVLVGVALPSAAAFVKRDIYAAVALGGVAQGSRPAELARLADAGVVTICGGQEAPVVSAPEPGDPGCGNAEGQLRLEDVEAVSARVLVAAMPAAGLGLVGTAVLAGVVAILAVLAAARQAVLTGSGAGGPGAALAALAVLAGGVASASLLEADLATRLAWALSISAAALFPPRLIEALWPEAPRIAGGLASIAGLFVCGAYLIGTGPMAGELTSLWLQVSNAPVWKLELLADLRAACAAGEATACAEGRQIAAEVANFLGLDPRASGLIGATAGLGVGLLTVAGAAVFGGRNRAVGNTSANEQN